MMPKLSSPNTQLQAPEKISTSSSSSPLNHKIEATRPEKKQPEHQVFWGPETFTRGKGKPETFKHTLNIPDGTYTLRIKNGADDGSLRVSSAQITIDGHPVAVPNDFNQQTAELSVSVSIKNPASLTVWLASKPGGFLVLTLLFSYTCPNQDGTLFNLETGTTTTLSAPDCQPMNTKPIVSLENDNIDEAVAINTVVPPPVQIFPDPGFQRGERIAYITQQDLYLTTPDGLTHKNITQTPYTEQHPVFSPDAKQIAYASDWLGRGWELFEISPIGRFQSRLTFDHLRSQPHAWSNQNELAFLNHQELYVRDMTSGTIRHLLPGIVVNSPTWAENGNTIALIYQGNIATLDRLGNHFRLITTNLDIQGQLAISPDGQTFVYDSAGSIYTLPATGGTPTLLSNQQDSEAIWSPDGKSLAFTSKRTGQREIFVMDANGGNSQQLTNHGGESYHPSW